MNVSQYGIGHSRVLRNPPPAVLYESALRDEGAQVVASGALATTSGVKTGRSPMDKRVVVEPASREHIWWGAVNLPLTTASFLANRQRAIEFFDSANLVYVVDGYAGWDPRYRVRVRVICTRPYHALFMHNMLIRPSEEELATFGDPDYVIFNAGARAADPDLEGNGSTTSVAISFARGEMVILGTEYAGEMKKGVFTIMNYLMPGRNVLSMHCSANEGHEGDVSLFFGLSGTGKTTLSADPRRRLIGDDEHCWSEDGIFNIEGGCYAKCIGLSPEKEPAIYQAIRFGTVLENVTFDPHTRRVNYNDASITENTRAAYPIEYIPNAKLPACGAHPRHLILLSCDAFGVLPPVSKLTPRQAMDFFLTGYTAKVAGTEQGIKEPQVTFSACFGAAFLVRPPGVYAEMLERKMQQHGTRAWLVNTGWTGGPYGEGHRISLEHTRAIIDAIHSGQLAEVESRPEPFLGLHVPEQCAGCPSEILQPRATWQDPARYDAAARHLAELFQQHQASHVPAGPLPSMMQAALRGQ